VRRIGRYEVVTHPNAAVPDVIVHAVADPKSTSVNSQTTGNSTGDHVIPSDDGAPQVQSPGSGDSRPPTTVVADSVAPVADGRKLTASGNVASSSLPQLSFVSGRPQTSSSSSSALYKTGSNNLSLGALQHAAAHVDAASQRQTLIRSRACRPCHDLSKVTVERPRFGSHFRLSAAVADVVPGGERTATTDDRDRSSLLQNIVVFDPAPHPDGDTHRPPGSDPGPPSKRLATSDGEAVTGRTLAGRGRLAVLIGGVRAWWSKSDDTSQGCADSWPKSITFRRRSAEEEISIALTRISLVSGSTVVDNTAYHSVYKRKMTAAYLTFYILKFLTVVDCKMSLVTPDSTCGL